MKKPIIYRYLLLALLLINAGTAALKAQLMWPGDANNNGIVSGVDLLYLGYAYGAGGPERTDATTDWEAQSISSLWPQAFPDGLNYAYADGNGDGFLDDDDLGDAIRQNFNLTHDALLSDGYANAPNAAAAPKLRLQSSSVIAEPGANLIIEVFLGDEQQPVTNFYGIAMKVSYDLGFIAADGGIEFEEVETGWINADNNALLGLSEKDEDQGLAWAAISRTNQAGISGSGKIGEFSIFIEDIIVGLEVDTFNIRIDSIRLIDGQFNTLPVKPDTLSFIITKDSALVVDVKTDQSYPLAETKLYPNPSQGLFILETPQPLINIRFFDLLGRSVWPAEVSHQHHQYRIDASNLPQGLYQLWGETEQGTFSQTIILSTSN